LVHAWKGRQAVAVKVETTRQRNRTTRQRNKVLKNY
jgi:hypothetical protein